MTGFLIRWGLALALLAATFNPTQYNFVRWVSQNYQDELAISVLAGLLLIVGYIIYLRATFRSIGVIGIALVTGIVAATIWVLADQGWLTLDDTDVMVWLGLFGLSFVFGIGLSWSHVRRALSGQSDMDDLDD